MHIRALTIFYILMWIIFPFNSHATFIAKKEDLKKYEKKTNMILIASTGRSGSTMLTKQIQEHVSSNKVLKTHLLPPSPKFKGKILFIFSNPNQAAESALYMTLHTREFGDNHFRHMETADQGWLKKIGSPLKQTEQDNLLAYDAFGTYEHLKAWLYTHTKPTTPENAQILAIKYENLWDESTVQTIRKFLNIPSFTLPSKRTRGHKEEQLFSKELKIRSMYNLGTKKDPVYAAYENATILWKEAPPFQYLEIIEGYSH